MKGLTEGRNTHYVLTADDANEINRRRYNRMPGDEIYNVDWPKGAQAHIGNPVSPGEHVVMIVVKVWDHDPEGPGTCNGQCILDGNDSLWVTSVLFSADGRPGTWHWIEQA